MPESMTLDDYKRLSQDITLMIQDNKLLRLSNELLILTGKGLLNAMNYPAESIYPIAEDLFNAISAAEKCTGKL